MSTERDRPIAIFDSGVGGLTVHAALRRLLPAEDLIYLGDTARLPYGTRSPEVVTRYAINNARFLAGFDPKLLVVACNTVSATALPALSASLPVPVLGMVEPGVAAALATGASRIGVIGTPGTVRAAAYQKLLAERAPAARIFAVACNLFVALAEEGWLDGDVARLTAERYLRPLRDAGIETLVLACTHFPLLRAVIAGTMGPTVTLVDSAETSAAAAADLLNARALRRTAGAGSERFLVTDLSDRFGALAERFLGRPAAAELVDITP